MLSRFAGLSMTMTAASSKQIFSPEGSVVFGAAKRSDRMATTSPGCRGWLNCETGRSLTVTAWNFSQVRTCLRFSSGQEVKRKGSNSAG